MFANVKNQQHRRLLVLLVGRAFQQARSEAEAIEQGVAEAHARLTVAFDESRRKQKELIDLLASLTRPQAKNP